jgi:hypothetical protein
VLKLLGVWMVSFPVIFVLLAASINDRDRQNVGSATFFFWALLGFLLAGLYMIFE